jgi:thiamine kinase-like enzyme
MRTLPYELTSGAGGKPETRAARANEQASAPPAPAQYAAEQLDLRNSPVVQRELPGLKSAFDADAMRDYLQAALFSKSSSYTIEHCAPGKAIYMGDCCVLRYELQVKDIAGGQTIKPIVVGRVFQDQLACAVYLRDRLAPLATLMRAHEEVAPFATPVAMIEPLNMLVHVFPIDGELPTLIGATDRQRMIEVFNETLPDALTDRFVAQECRVIPVNYARRYRCVMRYEIGGVAPSSNKPQQRVVYGKVATDSQGALIGPVVAALREYVSSNRAIEQFNVPRSLGFRPELQLSLLEAIPGTSKINQLLKARLNGSNQGPGEPLALEAAIEACARIAGTLHTSGITLGRRRTLDGELAKLRRDIEDVRRVAPELGARFRAWLERIESYSEESDALSFRFSHGDYTYTQLVFDGTQSGLVDFDTICQAEPALDLGQFLAYLRVAAHKAHKASASGATAIGDQLADRFLDAYSAAMGDRVEDQEWLKVRVSIYKIVSLMRMALHSWQQIKPARIENAIAVLEEEITCLPQLNY